MDNKPQKTILFVDDEDSILSVSSEYFQRKGYQTLTAKSGAEALKILKDQNVDCCFTDINMPEMNGLELAEKIRINDNTMPVIVMTGFPSLENTIQTIKNGVVDFLIKPVNLKQMELSVQRVIQQRKMFVENILLKKEVESKKRLEELNQELLYKVEELNILNKIMSKFEAISSSTDVFKRACGFDKLLCDQRSHPRTGRSFICSRESTSQSHRVPSSWNRPWHGVDTASQDS